MSPLPDDRAGLEPGEAYTTCIRELHKAHPDYERAQVYATLGLRDAMLEVAEQIRLASRR